MRFLALSLVLAALAASVAAQDEPDRVAGDLIQFNDNGAWSWYQDERVLVVPEQGRLFVGSDASGEGVGGAARDAQVEAVVFDLATRQPERFTFLEAGNADDHDVPAFLLRPDGAVLAMYATHYDAYSRYRTFDGKSWSDEEQFVWADIPGGSNFATTYSNLFYLSAEDRTYNVSRADERSPNLLVSDDYGDSWEYLGLLTEPDRTIGYVNGYFKYWSNGVDRVDFVATEHHPRDFDTSMYHGYIRGGQTFRSDGTLMDDDLTDQSAPTPADFTPVFEAGTPYNGQPLTRVWNHDVVRYPDGTIAALLQARIGDDPERPSNDPDHVFLYLRYDGTEWTPTYLGRAGRKLYSSEQDYTGLGALDPDDPTTIYVSTPVDPRDDAALGVHEIFRGTTDDDGATWAWEPITERSTRDNLRPIVPAWSASETALLWWRGTYSTAQRFDAAVVGLIERADETRSPLRYVDATPANTTRTDGGAVDATGPSADQGEIDGRWHVRTGFGNGDAVWASAERGSEDAPMLRTTLVPDETGTLDVFVLFWANPDADWRVRAGLAEDDLRLFRHMASQGVGEGEHTTTLVREGSTVALYRAYVGRVEAVAGQPLIVYVDDGATARTWYDGISTALVTGTSVATAPEPASLRLAPAVPNPFSSRTTIRYALAEPGPVTLRVFDVLGRVVRTLVDGDQPAGAHRATLDGAGLPSGTYLARLDADGQAATVHMVLIR